MIDISAGIVKKLVYQFLSSQPDPLTVRLKAIREFLERKIKCPEGTFKEGTPKQMLEVYATQFYGSLQVESKKIDVVSKNNKVRESEDDTASDTDKKLKSKAPKKGKFSDYEKNVIIAAVENFSKEEEIPTQFISPYFRDEYEQQDTKILKTLWDRLDEYLPNRPRSSKQGFVRRYILGKELNKSSFSEDDKITLLTLVGTYGTDMKSIGKIMRKTPDSCRQMLLVLDRKKTGPFTIKEDRELIEAVNKSTNNPDPKILPHSNIPWTKVTSLIPENRASIDYIRRWPLILKLNEMHGYPYSSFREFVAIKKHALTSEKEAVTAVRKPRNFLDIDANRYQMFKILKESGADDVSEVRWVDIDKKMAWGQNMAARHFKILEQKYLLDVGDTGTFPEIVDYFLQVYEDLKPPPSPKKSTVSSLPSSPTSSSKIKTISVEDQEIVCIDLSDDEIEEIVSPKKSKLPQTQSKQKHSHAHSQPPRSSQIKSNKAILNDYSGDEYADNIFDDAEDDLDDDLDAFEKLPGRLFSGDEDSTGDFPFRRSVVHSSSPVKAARNNSYPIIPVTSLLASLPVAKPVTKPVQQSQSSSHQIQRSVSQQSSQSQQRHQSSSMPSNQRVADKHKPNEKHKQQNKANTNRPPIPSSPSPFLRSTNNTTSPSPSPAKFIIQRPTGSRSTIQTAQSSTVSQARPAILPVVQQPLSEKKRKRDTDKAEDHHHHRQESVEQVQEKEKKHKKHKHHQSEIVESDPITAEPQLESHEDIAEEPSRKKQKKDKKEKKRQLQNEVTVITDNNHPKESKKEKKHKKNKGGIEESEVPQEAIVEEQEHHSDKKKRKKDKKNKRDNNGELEDDVIIVVKPTIDPNKVIDLCEEENENIQGQFHVTKEKKSKKEKKHNKDKSHQQQNHPLSSSNVQIISTMHNQPVLMRTIKGEALRQQAEEDTSSSSSLQPSFYTAISGDRIIDNPTIMPSSPPSRPQRSLVLLQQIGK